METIYLLGGDGCTIRLFVGRVKSPADGQRKVKAMADRQWGPGGWRWKTDRSIYGGYAVGPDGDTIGIFLESMLSVC